MYSCQHWEGASIASAILPEHLALPGSTGCARQRQAGLNIPTWDTQALENVTSLTSLAGPVTSLLSFNNTFFSDLS